MSDTKKNKAEETAGTSDVKAADDFADLKGAELEPIVVKEVVMPMSSFGIGPVFGIIAIGLTAFGIIFRDKWVFASGIPSSQVLRYMYVGIGVFLMLCGGKVWMDAVMTARVSEYIRTNRLCRESVYAWTRNPIYMAILFICTGALFISGNVYMYAIPILLWAILTLLLKKTEEKVLLKRFGAEYEDYMIEVNRILPKPPKKKEEGRRY